MPHAPPPLPERGRFARLYHWLNQLRDYVISLRPLQSIHTRTIHSAIGVGRSSNARGVAAEGATTEGIVYRGDWVETTEYSTRDMVTIRDGAAAGTYIAVSTPDLEEDPADGVNWVQIAHGDTVGRWE